MKRQWLGMIGLRLVGVYALIEALASFPRLAAGGMLLARDGRGGLIPFLVLFPYGVLLASGVLLLAHPAKAAGLVWPRGMGADDVQISADVANLAFAAAAEAEYQTAYDRHGVPRTVVLGVRAEL